MLVCSISLAYPSPIKFGQRFTMFFLREDWQATCLSNEILFKDYVSASMKIQEELCHQVYMYFSSLFLFEIL
jgi:hypothetical protein